MLLTYLYLSHSLKKILCTRKDGSILLGYATASDVGVKEELFSFYSGNYHLFGSRYFIDVPEYKGLVIFFHGLGGGRNAYTHLISRFVKEGYLVYAFDNTGSNQSEGPGIIGLGQYKNDIDAFFSWLDQDEKAKSLKRYAVGHSWGGYAAMLALENKKIEKAVSLSGFLSPISIVKDICHSKVVNALSFLIQLNFRLTVGKNGNKGAYKVICNTNKPLLYIQGEDDNIVNFPNNGGLISRLSQRKKNIQVIAIKNRRHSCYLTNEAEAYVENLVADARNFDKAGHIYTNLKKSGEEDPAIMKAIFDFLLK